MYRVPLFTILLVMLTMSCSELPQGVISLDGEWIYAPDSLQEGGKEGWYTIDYDRSSWKKALLPRYLDQIGLPGYVGSVWFARQFELSDSAAPLSVIFKGVDDDAEVWVNGMQIGFHSGYSEEFSFDISAALRRGENLIVVRTDNLGGPGGVYKSAMLAPTSEVPTLMRSPLADEDARSSPAWVRDAVVYEVSVRAFSPEGTFKALETQLPEIKKLGVTVLWLMPIHPVGEFNRKGSVGSPYSIADYYAVNPDFGTKEDFHSLVDAAHREGMKLIIDLVANHTSWDSKLIMEHPSWFTHDKEGAIVAPNPDWTDVADLNYDNHELRKYMIDMMVYWVREFDIDGYRCDVAELVPMDFWVTARRELESIKPVMMLAEGTLPEYHLEAFDVTYAWNTYDALGRVCAGKAGSELFDEQLEKESYRYPRGSLRLRFFTNHDKNFYDMPAVERYSREGAKAAAVLVMTYPGVPLLFNGEEIGNPRRLNHHENDKINWKGGDDFRELYEQLGALRLQHPALQHGTYKAVEASDSGHMYAFTREVEGDTVLTVLNCSDLTQEINLRPPDVNIPGLNCELGGEIVQADAAELRLRLKPHGFAILAPGPKGTEK